MKTWVIEQKWSHVLFLNWKVDAQLLQQVVPFKLDLYEGNAVLSIVPFYMDQIRLPWTPVVPWVSNLWELNLRTYVVHQGVPGIYFFTLDTSHVLANWIARKFFNLPYRYARLNCSVQDSRYILESHCEQYRLNLSAHLTDHKVNDASQVWTTERYHLFLKNGVKTMRGDVFHEPWKLKKAKVSMVEGNFSSLSGIQLMGSPDTSYFAESLKVRFSKFVQIE